MRANRWLVRVATVLGVAMLGSAMLGVAGCSKRDTDAPAEQDDAVTATAHDHAPAPDEAAKAAPATAVVPAVAAKGAQDAAEPAAAVPAEPSAPLDGDKSAAPAAAPAAPTAKPKIETFAAKIAGKTVKLSWSLPQGTTLIRVVRTLGTPAQKPDDEGAAAIYSGAAANATHPLADLLGPEPEGTNSTGSEYHYAAFACRSESDCDLPPARAQLKPRLLDALRKGGFVLYFRHATADVCQDIEPLGTADVTEKPGWWKSCDAHCATATARQLNAKGIAEAKQLGVELARLKVPVAKIVSSEFCRNVQTGKLMALRNHGKLVPIETAKELTSFVYDEKNRCKNIYRMMAQPTPRGSNTVLLGQKGNDCPVVGALDPAGVAIFKSDGEGTAYPVATLKLSDWASY